MTDDVVLFDLNGNQYQARKLNVFDQLKVVSKLAPVLGAMGKQENEIILKENFAQLLVAFNLQENDLQEIFKLCLGSIFRKTKSQWAVLYKNNNLMFKDVELKDMLNLLYKVLEVNNLINFFSASPSDLTENQE